MALALALAPAHAPAPPEPMALTICGWIPHPPTMNKLLSLDYILLARSIGAKAFTQSAVFRSGDMLGAAPRRVTEASRPRETGLGPAILASSSGLAPGKL